MKKLFLACIGLMAFLFTIRTVKSDVIRIPAAEFSSKGFVEKGLVKTNGPEPVVKAAKYANTMAATSWHPGNLLNFEINEKFDGVRTASKIIFRYICADSNGTRISVVVDDKYYFIHNLRRTANWNQYEIDEVVTAFPFHSGSRICLTNLGKSGMVMDYFEIENQVDGGKFTPSKGGELIIRATSYDKAEGGNVVRRMEYGGAPMITDWLQGVCVYWDIKQLAEKSKINKITFKYACAGKTDAVLNILDGDTVIETVALPRTSTWFAISEFSVDFKSPVGVSREPRLGLEFIKGGALVLESFTLGF